MMQYKISCLSKSYTDKKNENLMSSIEELSFHPLMRLYFIIFLLLTKVQLKHSIKRINKHTSINEGVAEMGHIL